MRIDNDFTRSVCFHNITENAAIGGKSDLHEYSVQFYQTFFFRLTVFDAQGCQFIAITDHFRRLRTHEYFHIRQRFKSFLKNIIRFQFIHKFKDGDFRTNTCQVNSCLDAGVSAADYRNVFPFIERTVAMRAESNSTPDIIVLAGNIQFSPACTCSDNQCRSNEFLSYGSSYQFIFSGKFYLFYLTLFQQINRITQKMRFQIIGKFASCCFGNRNQILNAYRLFHLSADTLGNNRHAQAFTSRIDGCRYSGRTATGYDNIIFLHFRLHLGFINTVLRFQFSKQFAKFATTYMKQFSIGKYRRYALYLQGIHFILIQCTVNHFMSNGRIQCGHCIQCLDYIRTVGTSQ